MFKHFEYKLSIIAVHKKLYRFVALLDETIRNLIGEN